MRKLFLSGVLILFTLQFLTAQTPGQIKVHRKSVADSKKYGTVVLSLDTIFNKGIPYALMRPFSAALIPDYSVRTLDEMEFLFLKYLSGNYNFIFTQSQKQVTISKVVMANIPKMIVDNAFVKNNQLDTVARERFILINQPPPKPKPVVSDPMKYDKSPTDPVGGANPARNNSEKVFLSGVKLTQSSVFIGTIDKNTFIQNGVMMEQIIFSSPAGAEVAEATRPSNTSGIWTVRTYPDNRTSAIPSDQFMRDAEIIAEYLVKLGLL